MLQVKILCAVLDATLSTDCQLTPVLAAEIAKNPGSKNWLFITSLQ
jgi:hypothetical protein